MKESCFIKRYAKAISKQMVKKFKRELDLFNVGEYITDYITIFGKRFPFALTVDYKEKLTLDISYEGKHITGTLDSLTESEVYRVITEHQD